MIKKTLILLLIVNTLVGDEIWVDDIAALYYGQKTVLNATVKDKKIIQEEISKISCLKEKRFFELKDKKLIDECDAVFVVLKRVYYTKTLFGTKKISKDKAKMPLNSFESVESVKKIYNPDAIKLFNAPFELSPRVSLKNIKVGDRVRLIVTASGKPKAGVSITYDKRVVAKSDVDGHANVEIKNRGLQKITASYKEKGDGIKCDEIIHSTALNIEVKK